MKVLNAFRVLEVDYEMGQLEVIWYDGTKNAQGQLVKPFNRQVRDKETLRQAHRIPEDFEVLSWGREELTLYWMNELPAIVSNVPQWAIEEAERTKMVLQERYVAR